jgi:histidine decarboxylase
VPLSKRFRALKLWFVLRNYGVSGLQKMIRENVRLAQKFEVTAQQTSKRTVPLIPPLPPPQAFVRSDNRFEVPAARHLGMLVFRWPPAPP